jgi:hypothetical protein
MKTQKLNVFKVIALMLICFIVSCKRIETKGGEIAHSVKTKIQDKTQRLSDKIAPRFDSDIADTEANKARFKDFLKVELTQNVKNVYCFADAVGIDADYMFAFQCDTNTVHKIIQANNLKPDTANLDNMFSLQHDFDWWDKKRISQLPKYVWFDGRSYYKYFWYDSTEGKAYYFDFDM